MLSRVESGVMWHIVARYLVLRWCRRVCVRVGDSLQNEIICERWCWHSAVSGAAACKPSCQQQALAFIACLREASLQTMIRQPEARHMKGPHPHSCLFDPDSPEDIVGSRLQYEPFFVPRQPVIRSQQFKKEPCLPPTNATQSGRAGLDVWGLGLALANGSLFPPIEVVSEQMPQPSCMWNFGCSRSF